VAEGEFRLRVCYGKTGRLRWLSHLEIVHAIERGVRRAGLEYAVTQGFSPHMKIAFGPALPVGTAGESEYCDVWLTRYTGAQELVGRLRDAMPADLAVKHGGFVGGKEPSLTAGFTIANYVVDVEGKELSADTVGAALARVVESGSMTVRHKGKDKVFDLARCLPKEVRVSESANGSSIALTVRIGPEGSLRPELLVQNAFEATSLHADVTRVTRTETLFEIEGGDWARPL
jgi:radical SAM-linked protein